MKISPSKDDRLISQLDVMKSLHFACSLSTATCTYTTESALNCRCPPAECIVYYRTGGVTLTGDNLHHLRCVQSRWTVRAKIDRCEILPNVLYNHDNLWLKISMILVYGFVTLCVGLVYFQQFLNSRVLSQDLDPRCRRCNRSRLPRSGREV